MKTTPIIATASLAAALVLPLQTTVASILLLEDFNYSVGGSLNGQNGGTGWGGSWGSSSLTSTTIVAGLTFSDYAVSGNAAQIYRARYGSGTIGRSVGVAPAASELWTSSLYQYAGPNFDGQTDLFASTNELRVSTLQSGGTITMSQGYKAGGEDGWGNSDNNFGLRIDSTNTVTAANSLQNQSTYLLIGKFTGLGNTESTGILWALSAANYDAIKAGGITEGELNSNNIGKLTSTSSGSVSFGPSNFVQLYAGNGAFTVDEIRFGDALIDVTAVPEPTISVVLLGAGLSLAFVRRRQSSPA